MERDRMTYNEVMKKLKKMGTAQNRKVYGRHGVGEKMYGVSYADLNKLKKQIKVDHELALKMWASGNHDARVLATMVVDADQIKSAVLDSWAKDLDNYVITDAFSSMTARSPHLKKKMEKWTKSKNEWIGRTGWALLGRVAYKDEALSDGYFTKYLGEIEKGIHAGKNRVRDAMNNAVINIGLRNGQLEKKAIAAAKRIGRVEVDHGETGCKTPDAIDYIKKTKAYRAKKKQKKIC
jgi:3-methyladenine DNA glycosylase AlkD